MVRMCIDVNANELKDFKKKSRKDLVQDIVDRYANVEYFDLDMVEEATKRKSEE